MTENLHSGLPLFNWCEIQGLFHDFPGAFQGNPGPSLSTNTWLLYIFFFKTNFIIRLYWIDWSWQWKTTYDRSLWTKIGPYEVAVFVLHHCGIKSILTNSIFLLFLGIKKEIFCPFQDFQTPRPKFKDFPGTGKFFAQCQDFPGFSRTVATLYTTKILRTSKIFCSGSIFLFF